MRGPITMKQAFSRRLSNWLRPRNPYDWHYNGETWLLNRLAGFHPSIVFDVGANVGDWSMLARNALPDAQLHAFEIVESTYAALRDRLAGNAGLVLNNFGLSDKSGTITMHLFNGTNELTSHVAYPHGDYRIVICPVRRGDEYMQDHGIERIDLLKIDVRGC